MDGGGSDCIEERFAELTVEGKIRGRMKERGGRFFFWYEIFFLFRLLGWSLMNSAVLMT
jgi:hypothetical protein